MECNAQRGALSPVQDDDVTQIECVYDGGMSAERQFKTTLVERRRERDERRTSLFVYWSKVKIIIILNAVMITLNDIVDNNIKSVFIPYIFYMAKQILHYYSYYKIHIFIPFKI